MHLSTLLKIALFTFALVICTHNGSFRAGAGGVSNNDILDTPLPNIRILDTIPQGDAGISNTISVPDDTGFGVLIESRYQIDLADSDSIRFEIDDGIHTIYERDLGSDTLRVLEVTGNDPQKNLIWVVYDRSLETKLPPLFFPDKIVHITIQLLDTQRNTISAREFRFKIESDPGHSTAFDRLPDYEFVGNSDLIYETHYDSGMEILSGELEGAKILFDSNEPLTPGFGPSDDVEALIIDGEEGIGEPLNLVPHAVFHEPVTIFIPFPEGTDLEETDIFYHNGVEWLRACDADGNVLPGGIGWMVAGSRVNHYGTSPPSVELQVYHFSSVQGFVAFRGSAKTGSSGGTHTGSGGFAAIECFIGAAAYKVEIQQILGLLVLFFVLVTLGVLPLIKDRLHTKWNGFLSYTKPFRQD